MLRYMIAASCCGVWVGERSGRPTSPTKRVSPVKTRPAGPARRDHSSECKCFRACVQEFAGTGGGTVRTEFRLRP